MYKNVSVLSKLLLLYFFFVKQDKTVKSRFWLFNLCSSEKRQNRPTWGGGGGHILEQFEYFNY